MNHEIGYWMKKEDQLCTLLLWGWQRVWHTLSVHEEERTGYI